MKAREPSGRGLALAGLATLLLAGLTRNGFLDPDLWHELALAREAWRAGALPLADSFAFTPTVFPAVRVSMDGRYEVAYPAGSLERARTLVGEFP